MCEHESRDAGMRRHHSRFGESDACLLHVDELVDEEIGTGIGQRRIADGWPDALVFLAMLLLDGEVFIGCIAPIRSIFSHLFVEFLCRSLSESVGQGLCHHVEIVVMAIFVDDGSIHRCAKHSCLVSDALGKRTDEVSKTEIGFAWCRRMLLAEHRESDFFFG